MGVRGRLLRDLLSSLKYIKNLSEQQIRASLWRGEGMLYNIEFDPRHLQELLVDVCPVGLEILSLHVDELYTKIPWSQLGTQSVLVVAKCVTVRFELHCEGEHAWRETIGPMLRRERQKKQRTLYAAPGSLTDPAGALNQLRQRLLHSLQLRADRVRLSISSRQRRHFSCHRPEPPEGLEESLVVEFEDVSLTPCDAEHKPSDQMKDMAVYEPQDRVLQLTRLLKCRAFTVQPPAGPAPCPHAASEFLEAPCVLQCSIVDRCTSDGPRICPVLLSTELLFDVPQKLSIKCCECQLCAFLALVSDVGQLEEWRLDEELISGRQPEALMDTSDVARTFAQGPAKRKPQPRARKKSFIRATSAFGVSSSFWSGGSNSGGRKKTSCEDSPVSPESLAERSALELAEQPAASGEAGRNDEPAAMKEGVCETLEEEEEEQEPEQEQEQELEQEDDDELFLDAEEQDYFSVASAESPSGASEGPKFLKSEWLHKMRSWFRSSSPTLQCEEDSTVDLSAHRNRLALSFSSLCVQVAVQAPGGASECLEYSGERVSLRLDAKYEFTEAQRECVRRFAWPSEERPVPLWPWQLPRRVAASQRLDFQRFGLELGGAELLRGLRPEQSEEDEEPMLTLTIRPRSAPPETLSSAAGGELTTWPGQLSITHAMLLLEVKALSAVAALYKRVKPFLAGKVPPPGLIAPTGLPKAPQQQRLFPAECLMVEFRDCSFAEVGEAAIQEELRWPWRGFVPRLVLRSDSALWDLAGVLGEGAPGSGEGLQCQGGPPPPPEEGTVTIPQEMFDELVRRAAETTRKDSEVSAAREELQRAYISLATSRPHGHSAARAAPAAGEPRASASDDEQDELDRLRQKCLQLELSLQSQALAQRRLETELAHHQARAQEELRRLLVVGRGRSS